MQVQSQAHQMQLQIKAQGAGVKRGTLEATTNNAEDAGVKRGTLDATTNKGTRCRCTERPIRCN